MSLASAVLTANATAPKNFTSYFLPLTSYFLPIDIYAPIEKIGQGKL